MTETNQPVEALKDAIQIISGGNVRKASRIIGVSYSTLTTWISRNQKTPAEYCRQIEALTQYEITRSDLRPDVFGPNRMDEIKKAHITPAERVVAYHLTTHHTPEPEAVIQYLQTRFGYNAKEAVSIYANIREAGLYGE